MPCALATSQARATIANGDSSEHKSGGVWWFASARLQNQRAPHTRLRRRKLRFGKLVKLPWHKRRKGQVCHQLAQRRVLLLAQRIDEKLWRCVVVARRRRWLAGVVLAGAVDRHMRRLRASVTMDERNARHKKHKNKTDRQVPEHVLRGMPA